MVGILAPHLEVKLLDVASSNLNHKLLCFGHFVVADWLQRRLLVAKGSEA
jgi:hypothetical protein